MHNPVQLFICVQHELSQFFAALYFNLTIYYDE